jgi:hypothetical protein
VTGSIIRDGCTQTPHPDTADNPSVTYRLHVDTAETTTSIGADTRTEKVGGTTVASYRNLNAPPGMQQRTGVRLLRYESIAS